MPLGETCPVQMDKASAHNAINSRAAIATEGITLLDWPGNSPDLNAIEGVWGLLKLRINKLRPRPLTTSQIQAAIQNAWSELKPEDFVNLVDSTPDRIQAVLAAEGGPTRF